MKANKEYKVGLSRIIQKAVPTTKERTRRAIVGDRHNIEHPFLNLGGWYKTVVSGRVVSLFLTKDGYMGHAYQIQQELNRLSATIDAGYFRDSQSLQTALEYEKSIKNRIITEAQKVNFDFPKTVFYLSKNKAFSIQRLNGKLYLNQTEHH